VHPQARRSPLAAVILLLINRIHYSLVDVNGCECP
jgi:hypothetical protein